MTRYLIFWTMGVLVLIAAVAALNFVVDPYIVYRKFSSSQFNDVKPRAQQQGRLSKRAGIAQIKPRALVLGNSRAEIGFDPAHRAWPQTAQPVFNAALPGTGLRASIDMLRYAVDTSSPTVAVVAIEFNDFLVHPNADTTANPIHSPNAPQPFEALKSRLNEITATLFSLDALADSVQTLIARFDPHAATLRRDGFNPMRDYPAIAAREGYHALFRQRNMEYVRTYLKSPHNIYTGNSRTSPDFEALRDLLKFARQRHIDLKLVIYPYHANFLDIVESVGLWPTFEQWKHTLVDIVDREAADSGVAPFTLLDFSGYHAYAREPVPAPGNTRQSVRWYWEAGHFKKELGDLMLARIFAASPPHDEPAFGIVITPKNIQMHLDTLRQQAQDYAHTHRQAKTEVADLVKRMRGTP